MNCLGCRLATGLDPAYIVYEDDVVCCFLDIDPFHEGHTLILPKNHVVELEELDKKTLMAVMDAAKMLASVLKQIYKVDGISICQNGGSCNDLNHFHLHVIPRFDGDGFSWEESLRRQNADKRLDEVQSTIRAFILKST
ncbi:HIT family protein [Brevibacillus invocatus]|uniref:HIT family protein n=1 Tax=Brevibacillus invocatus TaxID=173959 RepID=A0A3M8CIV1_9BACL|nr:HIT family protein [Brevibacillus invocatus]MCM3079006.1 HIT family protein [Brevibacillus invocatus]MCM3432069.1 HIT family protein [Brevibacillus invocatus]RNB74805.1 HIT family protein [Brevibacillus invocatus]